MDVTNPRTSMLITLAALGALAGLVPADAEACSIAYEPLVLPADGSMDFPANGLFSKEVLQWSKADGTALEFVDDMALASAIGSNGSPTLWRPVQALTPGETLTSEQCYFTERCTVVVGEPDLEAPTEPVLSDAFVYLDRPEKQGVFQRNFVDSCGFTGEYHYLEFQAQSEDDRTDLAQMWMLVYAGPDASSVQSGASAVRFEWPLRYMAAGAPFQLPLYEDDLLLPSNAPFCVAIELVDQAGNISPRSQPLCVDPTDRRAPNVGGPGAAGCACATTAPAEAPAGMLAIALLGLVAMRRGARTENRRGARS